MFQIFQVVEIPQVEVFVKTQTCAVSWTVFFLSCVFFCFSVCKSHIQETDFKTNPSGL